MTLNPYASHLGERDAREVIAATPERLRLLLDQMGPERVAQPLAPGKWSPREILCHLADTELVFAFRLRQTLAEPHHVIQPYDQDNWARHYGAYSAAEALAMFRTARQWNIALIESLPRESLVKPVTHPERGSMTFQVLVETMGGHDLNHLRQIEGIVGSSG